MHLVYEVYLHHHQNAMCNIDQDHSAYIVVYSIKVSKIINENVGTTLRDRLRLCISLEYIDRERSFSLSTIAVCTLYALCAHTAWYHRVRGASGWIDINDSVVI